MYIFTLGASTFATNIGLYLSNEDYNNVLDRNYVLYWK